MQSVRWYFRRLRAMSAGELAWRCRGKLREAIDRRLIQRRQVASSWNRIVSAHAGSRLTDPDVVGLHLRGLGAHAHEHEIQDWRAGLLAEADRLLERRLRIFDVDYQYPGPEIDWNYEPKAGKSTPMGPATDVDYRDHQVTGDCKFVWEPNRHHHLVVLARAYRVSGDEKYAQAATAQLESWIRQCPYGMGMNWRSPLELSIRLINWVWTLGLLEGSSTLTGEFMRRVLPVAYRHLWEVSRNYSRHSSANNHLIGEAAGVFIASSYFCGLKDARRWRQQAGDILLREILAQTHEDGGTREQAWGYHLFVLQFFLLSGLVARNVGDDFEPVYWDRLEAMLDFVAGMTEAGPAPAFGDADDGYVLDLGGRDQTGPSLLGIGAVMYQRPEWAAKSGEQEPAWWLFGSKEGREEIHETPPLRFDASSKSPALRAHVGSSGEVRPGIFGLPGAAGILASRAFSESGYYLLQRGGIHDADRVSVVFDCGPLGFQSIAAHGHADALSVTLRVGGHEILMDPGTYDYFTFPEWREYFRSTEAHNTVMLDGQDQSERLGPFLWGRRAEARLLHWMPTSLGGTVRGEHDGYRRLADPALHRRTVTLDGEEPEVLIHDEVFSRGRHEAAFHWHFAEHCRVRPLGENEWEIGFPGGLLRMKMDPELSVSSHVGCAETRLGWISRAYHQRAASTTIAARCTLHGSRSFTTRFALVEIATTKPSPWPRPVPEEKQICGVLMP